MDFDDFFSHPFILSTSISSSSSLTTSHSCDRAPSTSSASSSALQQPQLCSPVASPVGSSVLPRPSSITSGEKYLRAESRRQYPHARVARIKEEESTIADNLKQQQPRSSQSIAPNTAAAPGSRSKSSDVSSDHHRSTKSGDHNANKTTVTATTAGAESSGSSGSSTGGDNFEDFVMINEDIVSTITATGNCGPVQPSLPGFTRLLSGVRPYVNYMPEPLPVPTQRAAFEAIQRSSGSNMSSVGVIQESGSSSVAMLTSPPGTPPSKARFDGSRRAGAGSQNQPQSQEPSSSGAMNLKRHDSSSSIGSAGSACSRGSRTNMLLTDVSNITPPSMNFVLGSSGSPTTPAGIVSSSNFASMNRSRRLSVPYSPGPAQISPSTYFNWYVYTI